MKVNDKIALVGAVISLAAALGTIIYANGQLDEMKASRRAWLNAKPFEVSYDVKNTQIAFYISNTGQTPAHNVTFGTKADILASSLDQKYQFSLPTKFSTSRMVIFPNDMRVIFAQGDPPVSDDMIRSINSSNELYVWGTIKYCDVFNHFHYTNFCNFISGENLRKIRPIAYRDEKVKNNEYVFGDCDRNNVIGDMTTQDNYCDSSGEVKVDYPPSP